MCTETAQGWLLGPAPLLQAHQELDRAVDRCYRPEPLPSDRHRVEYLFALYEKLTAPLVAAAKLPRKRRKARTALSLCRAELGCALQPHPAMT